MPWYLKQTSGEIIEKFRYIQRQEDLRLRDATLNPLDSRWSLGVSVSEENDDRNRYVNIMPYEKNRVKLNVEGGNDYINASYVKVFVPEQSLTPGHYIATQGPTKNTWQQFWQMCYQQCPEDNIVIVMVTPLQEGGREKCYKYWPRNESETLSVPRTQSSGEFEKDCSEFKIDLEVFFERSERENDYTLSFLKLKPLDSAFPTKTVHHFYFDQWSDMSKPDEIVPILKLSNHCHVLNSPPNPIIVHCSAGVGRTGTFITLDHLIHNTIDFCENDPLTNYKHDLIEQIVLQLRSQRLRMVQMSDQYLFVYHAAKHAFSMKRVK